MQRARAAPMARTLTAVFSRPRGKPRGVGPFGCLRLEGECMREAAGGPLIAEHWGHEWHVDGERFSRLDVEGPVNVHFVDHSSSKTYGPFSSFSAVNGVAFRERSVFAFVRSKATIPGTARKTAAAGPT